MSSGSGASSSHEDVSWHQSDCMYRKFVQKNTEGCLLTDKEIRKELGNKYKRDVSRASGPTRRTKQKRRRVAKLLTPQEKAAVNDKVDQAMTQDGSIRWYLDSQRREMQETKERLKQECRCIKETDADEHDFQNSPEGHIEEVVEAEPVTAQSSVDDEVDDDTDESTVNEEEAEEEAVEEDGVFYF